MYNRLTKSSINFDITRRINTDNTPFYAILYLFKNDNKILVENPEKGICRQLNSSEINKFIKLNKIKTQWIQNVDGSYIRIIDHTIHHILPITHEFQLININFRYPIKNHTDSKRIRPVLEKNFKLTKSRSTKDTGGEITISAFLPIWPVWVRVKRDLKNTLSQFQLRTVYMKHKSQFYRFPYGNVSGQDAVCTGGANYGNYATAEQIWINWFTTMFNRDYKLNLKANKFYFKMTGISDETVIEPTFDLNEIALKLYSKEYRNLNLIDVFYYLSNIEEFDNLEMDKLFIKLPQNPWEKSKKE